MTKRTRNILWTICILLTLGALVAWLATGARGWTRYPSENLAAVEAGSDEGLGDLFADTGLEDESGALEKIDNEFRFGLLPSGPGRDAISVASVAGPCAVIAGLAFWLERRKRPQSAPAG